ncbi:MAG: FAS1-like dehydratase domain-containing protein [Candidatus Binataceae bacterium]
MRAWVGREVSYTAPEALGRAAIRYFALAIGDDNPLYIDEAYAQAARFPSIVAPPTLVCETSQYAHREPNEDGYIGHSWNLPLKGFRMIRGGHDYEFFRRVTPDDRISVVWRLDEITEHTSPRGGTMLIAIALASYSNQHGELLAHNRETLIFQPLER